MSAPPRAGTGAGGMLRHSLALRLLAVAAVWLVAALGGTGWLLSALFARHVDQTYVRQLEHQLSSRPPPSTGTAGTGPDPRAGRPALRAAVFGRLLAGPCRQGAAALALAVGYGNAGRRHRRVDGTTADVRPGPEGQSLLVVARRIVLASADTPVELAVALDRTELRTARRLQPDAVVVADGTRRRPAARGGGTGEIRPAPLARLRQALAGMQARRESRLGGARRARSNRWCARSTRCWRTMPVRWSARAGRRRISPTRSRHRWPCWPTTRTRCPARRRHPRGGRSKQCGAGGTALARASRCRRGRLARHAHRRRRGSRRTGARAGPPARGEGTRDRGGRQRAFRRRPARPAGNAGQPVRQRSPVGALARAGLAVGVRRGVRCGPAGTVDNATAGAMLQVLVEDDGPGMPPEARAGPPSASAASTRAPPAAAWAWPS